MLENFLVEFISTMQRQNLLLNDIAALGTQKQQLIIRGQIQDLDDLLKNENKLVADLEELENIRFELQKKIQSAWQIDAVAQMLEKAGTDYPNIYHDLDKSLHDLSYNLSRLQLINEHNNELIQQSLDYIANMRFILTGGSSGNYTDKGLGTEDEVLSRPAKLLDKRI